MLFVNALSGIMVHRDKGKDASVRLKVPHHFDISHLSALICIGIVIVIWHAVFEYLCCYSVKERDKTRFGGNDF